MTQIENDEATSLALLPLFADEPSKENRDDSTLPAGMASTSPSALPFGVAPTNGSAAASTTNGTRVRDIDWPLVNAFRARASEQLTAATQSREALSSGAQRELGRKIILELLDAATQDDTVAGNPTWSVGEQQRMAEAVFDALFGLGRLQPLVDDERVENIEITGHDQVILEYADGSLHEGPAVADSDEELVAFLTFLASRSEANARPFSESHPRLHLRLDGGARLAATAWVTPRPAVVIRRHRLREITLDDLVGRGMLTFTAASFLRAAVRAKKSIVVAGPQGAGKTTMVRALCAELDPWERIGTFETEYELHLHELPNQHKRVVPWEARPGSGERGIDGRQAGEFTLNDALFDSFRFNLSRQIVGEVRGPEILAMIKAMESGAGSISTTHAGTADGAIRKLVTCALEAGPQVTESYALRAITENINIVVQLHMGQASADVGDAGQRQRWVDEVITVHPGEKERGYSTTHVFSAQPGGPAAPHVLPDDYRGLTHFGFDFEAFTREAR